MEKYVVTMSSFCISCNSYLQKSSLFSKLALADSCICFYFQPGKYVWMSYKEVYDIVIKVGNSIRSCGVDKVSSVYIFYVIYFAKRLVDSKNNANYKCL